MPAPCRARRRPLAALALVGLFALAMLPGCSQRDPVQAEIYAEVNASRIENGTEVFEGRDGSNAKTLDCPDTVRYEAHISPRMGTVTVTITDGAGATTRATYDAPRADERQLEGAAGTWSLKVEWQGFSGALHAALTC